ncbi:unnamed protein product [Ectocarpus sp. 12 AP-2014]
MKRVDAERGEVDVEEALSRKDEVLLDSVLACFIEEESRVQVFSDIVHHKNGLSLRIIDWLITNFTKSFSVAIESDGLPRNLRRDYHKNLSAHNKKNFDPFARRRRIHIVLFGKVQRVSTIGQLNFFRWFLQKNLVGFLLENKVVIEKHIKDSDTNQDRIVKRKLAMAAQSPPEKNHRHKEDPAKAKAEAEADAEADAEAKAKAKAKAKPEGCVAEPQLFSGTFRMSF